MTPHPDAARDEDMGRGLGAALTISFGALVGIGVMLSWLLA